MKGWVGLVGRLVADSLPTVVITYQLQVESRMGKVCWPKTDVLPLWCTWWCTDEKPNRCYYCSNYFYFPHCGRAAAKSIHSGVEMKCTLQCSQPLVRTAHTGWVCRGRWRHDCNSAAVCVSEVHWTDSISCPPHELYLSTGTRTYSTNYHAPQTAANSDTDQPLWITCHMMMNLDSQLSD